MPVAVLQECIDLAVQAPTASNMQTWHFVFVAERHRIEALAAL